MYEVSAAFPTAVFLLGMRTWAITQAKRLYVLDKRFNLYTTATNKPKDKIGHYWISSSRSGRI